MGTPAPAHTTGTTILTSSIDPPIHLDAHPPTPSADPDGIPDQSLTGGPGEAGLAGFCPPCWEHSGEVHRPLPMQYALAVERITAGRVPAYVCPLVEGVWHIDAEVTVRVVMAMQDRFAGKRS